MKKREMINRYDRLFEENQKLYDRIIEIDKELTQLKSKNTKVSIDYVVLLSKYNKLINDIKNKDTKNIVYNGNLYGISKIVHYKKIESVDTIKIIAKQKLENKGLVNELGDTFKNAYDSLEKLLFGNKK